MKAPFSRNEKIEGGNKAWKCRTCEVAEHCPKVKIGVEEGTILNSQSFCGIS